MNQNKYREKLQNRTIDPSFDSWERLQIKLDSHKKKEKGRKWQFLKYAAGILILISVGLYFSERKEDLINDPKIVMPSPIEQLNNSYEITNDPEVEVAASRGDSTIEKSISHSRQVTIPSDKDEFALKGAARADSSNETEISVIRVTEKGVLDSLSETFVQFEALPTEEKALEDEVAQLLSQSKIKLRLNDPNSSAKEVSANVLLNEVEADLDKDLKQKLLEKIANTLKNPKNAVTFQEN
jgi:hypothetical protein